MEWYQSLIRQLTAVCGRERTMEMTLTVIPGIVNDFRKMLEKNPYAQETYMIDDGSASIRMKGQRGQIKEVIVSKTVGRG